MELPKSVKCKKSFRHSGKLFWPLEKIPFLHFVALFLPFRKETTDQIKKQAKQTRSRTKTSCAMVLTKTKIKVDKSRFLGSQSEIGK